MKIHEQVRHQNCKIYIYIELKYRVEGGQRTFGHTAHLVQKADDG